jgi:hypothetical protein
MVGKKLPDGLVQAQQVPVPESDTDQRRDEALGHRADLVAAAGVDVLPVAFVHQIAMAYHEHAADLGVAVGDPGVQVLQDRRIQRGLTQLWGLQATSSRYGGTPAGPLNDPVRLPSAGRHLPPRLSSGLRQRQLCYLHMEDTRAGARPEIWLGGAGVQFADPFRR